MEEQGRSQQGWASIDLGRESGFHSGSTIWASLRWLRQQRIYLQCRRPGFQSLGQEDPLRAEWQSTLLFLPQEPHGQRNLVGPQSMGLQKREGTERLTHLKVRFHHLCYSLPIGISTII